jgi:predicted nucleic acid-binding protein
MGWIDALRGCKVGLDTAPCVYYTEENPAYIDVIAPFFEAVGRGDITVVTSVVTLLEVLVHPYKDGNIKLAQRYHDLLFRTQGLTTIVLNLRIAEEAARLRAFHNIRTPDSIQIATAISEEASFFLTNDIHLPSLPNLKMLVLDNLKKALWGDSRRSAEMSTYAYRDVLNKVLNQVQHLTPDDQLRLVEDLVANLRRQATTHPKHSILELEGLGKEVWEGINVHDYINQERDSWNG